jgi:hypothetical protein
MTTLYDIALASYPRSGNTFLRHILLEVFGVFSWNSLSRYRFLQDVVSSPRVREEDLFFMNDRHYSPEELRRLLPHRVIKVHERPGDAEGYPDASTFVVCVVRDGRDAVVSEAYHRTLITEPGSPFADNLKEAILAEGGSHFGGWSLNASEWLRRADLVIHFEQLIKDPVRCITHLAEVARLPQPDFSALPTFASQKNGEHLYVSAQRGENVSENFFRRGEAGAWREEMPKELLDIFMEKHGWLLEELGYLNDDQSALRFLIP